MLNNIILDKFYDKLCTSDHQFGFKSQCSTNMCTMVLKETISYYIRNQSSVFCTFLDASKAFDRVRYCKLFRLLLRRGLPACIIRILIVLYTTSEVRVLWAGLYSDYFSALNGVKQGGVISPILFCIYLDDLLVRLATSGVGCFIGLNFVGALAYADDISLLAPNPSAMRTLLRICDTFAAEYDIQFNPDKSKFLVIASNKRRQLYREMCLCSFSIDTRCIDNVDNFVHLGHIITSSFVDLDDILHRRNSFAGQTNHVLCFFNKLDMHVKLKLFVSYCSSIYGCELWTLNSPSVEYFCVAWRKALKRILGLPFNCHSYLLPFISNTLPIFDEICKRAARFIISCLSSPNKLVFSVARYCVMYARYGSIVGSNALFCCERYQWSYDQFIQNADVCSFSNSIAKRQFIKNLTDSELRNAEFLLELLSIREGYSALPFEFLNSVQLNDIIADVATN